jgi:hypothetical protein
MHDTAVGIANSFRAQVASFRAQVASPAVSPERSWWAYLMAVLIN